MTFYLAAPASVTRPPEDVETSHLSHTWTGWDGGTWALSSAASGVRLMRGYRGTSMPPVTRYLSETPALAGTRWRGARTLEREVFLPLYVYGEPGQAWLDYDRAFWRSMDPERPGTWTVTQPNGESRSLVCRFVDDGGFSVDIDPAFVGWARYGLTLVAEDPYWRGAPITRSWSSDGESDDYYGVGKPYVYFISSGQTLATATMTNPGQVPAYPVWEVKGSTTSVEVGVGGRIIELPVPLAEGETRVIDTNPSAQTMVDGDGVDVTSELGEVDFAPIEPGESVALSLSMVGSGSVSVSIRPGYWRAW